MEGIRMTVELNVSLDRRNLARFRNLLRASRLTAAKALTFVAEDAEEDWRDGLSVFHQRNTWLGKGVRKRAATPGNLVAKVGTIDKHFGRHVKGLNEDKGGRLFIPAYGDISQAPTHRKMRAKIGAAKRTKTRKPFWLRDDRGFTWLARRVGKKRAPLKILGKMQNGARVPDRFDAKGIVERAVARGFPTTYERLLVRWLETGR